MTYESASSIGQRVTDLLISHQMEQADLAAKVEMTPDKMSKSLHGLRNFTSLEVALIADYFGVTVYHLLGLPEDCEPDGTDQ